MLPSPLLLSQNRVTVVRLAPLVLLVLPVPLELLALLALLARMEIVVRL